LPMSKTQDINCAFLAGSGFVFEISSSFWQKCPRQKKKNYGNSNIAKI
jgi:hypothetical protein